MARHEQAGAPNRTLDDAEAKSEAYRIDYNEVRPRSSLDNQTPAEFTRRITPLAHSAV